MDVAAGRLTARAAHIYIYIYIYIYLLLEIERSASEIFGKSEIPTKLIIQRIKKKKRLVK
jgi:hypothetical protein